MPIVDLKKVKPATASVLVGGVTLEMRAASIDRCERLFEVIGALELEKIAAPIIALITQLRAGGGTVADVFTLIKDNAASLIATVRPIIGKQLAPALRGAVIAVLDTQATRRALTTPLPAEDGKHDPTNTPLGIAADDDGDVERDDDGIYLGSRLVRAYLREEVTLAQAVNIVVEAVRLNDFRGALGNLWVGLTASEPAPEEAEAPTVANKAQRAAKR